jgi:hypothetical protein
MDQTEGLNQDITKVRRTLNSASALRVFSLVMSILVQPGCTTTPTSPIASARSSAVLPDESEEVYMALLSYMLNRWRSDRFCVVSNGSDPPRELHQYLAAKHTIVPGSQWHQKGVVCSVERVVFDSKVRATVRGGYQFDKHGGLSGPFTLRKQEGIWKVVAWHPDTFF